MSHTADERAPEAVAPYETLVALAQTDACARECMAEMASALRAILGLEGLERFPSDKALPAGFFERYTDALCAYDRYIAHVLDAESLAVSCRAGCAACCAHELARGIGTLEILAIYRLVRPWPDIGAIYERAGENSVAFRRLLAAELARDPRPLGPDDPRVLSAHLAYNRLKRPCPFLDQAQGACRIYPVRPLVCRWFFNLSPAEWCDPDSPHYAGRNGLGIDPYREVKGLLAALGERLGVATVNYLSGAFVQIAGDLLEGAPIRIRDT